MRRWMLVGTLLVLVGCVGPHSTGALWALQNAQEDGPIFAMSDAARAAQAHAVELSLADAELAKERARVQVCRSDEPQPPAVSVGDKVRDGIRVRIGDDPARLAQVAEIALADWYGRRGMCDVALAALNGTLPAAQRDPTLDALGTTTVSRGAAKPFQGEVSVALGLYAAGAIDAVTARGPLPHYLAAVYGGSEQTSAGRENAAAVVDRVAPAYPEWEPDALFAALR
jgi:hypothetical protein